MENLPGTYQKAVKACTLPSPVKRKSRWTLLLVEDCGRSIQIRWYKAWIVFVLLLISAASGTAVFTYYLYYTASAENRSLRARLNKADAQNPLLTQTRQSVPKAAETEKGKTVFPPPVNAEKSRKPEGQTDSGKTASPASAEKSADSGVQEKTGSESVSNAGESITSSLSALRVSAGEFACSFSELRESLNIRFHIRNTNPDAGPVSGQVFVILKPESVREWLLLPEGKTISGKIPDDAAGESFSISKFRSVEMRAKGQKKSDAYKSATVIVFDENRNILLEEDFPVVMENPS